MVMQEALRYRPSTPNGHFYKLTKDCKLGKYEFKKDDRLLIMLEALGHNSDEWQRPMDFIPERFDSNSEFYLTPSGKKRKSTSWAPFHGG